MKDDVRMEEQDKRLEWVAPAITEWDVVAETQAATGIGTDGVNFSA
jgi:hypothetical protein